MNGWQGGIEVLVQLLTSESPIVQEAAAGALLFLTQDEKGRVATIRADGVDALAKVVRRGTVMAQADAANALLHILKSGAICAGSAGALLNLAAVGGQHAQEAAVGAMVYMTLSKEGAEAFIQERGPLVMVRVLAGGTPVAAEMAAIVIANVSSGDVGREACLDAGGAHVLSNMMSQEKTTTKVVGIMP